jgi:hypothetical protein
MSLFTTGASRKLQSFAAGVKQNWQGLREQNWNISSSSY